VKIIPNEERDFFYRLTKIGLCRDNMSFPMLQLLCGNWKGIKNRNMFKTSNKNLPYFITLRGLESEFGVRVRIVLSIAWLAHGSCRRWVRKAVKFTPACYASFYSQWGLDGSFKYMLHINFALFSRTLLNRH
jgi:hypothetical protein